jgi:hypothetical protein
MLSNKWALFSLRRTAFFMMSLVLLTVLFAQFAVATEGNISGITFLDVNSNGELDPSEPPLQNYTIYIDTNSNSWFDLGENAKKTDKSGMYRFSNISGSGIVRASSGDQYQPSREGYNLNEVTTNNMDKLNFGYSMPKAAESAPNGLVLILIGLVAFVIIVFGGIVLKKGLLRSDSSTNKDIKEGRKPIIQIVSGFFLLLLGLYLLISLAQMSRYAINGATTGMSSSFTLVTPVVLALLLFGAILLMLYAHFKMKANEPGEMRKTIAGLLVLGLVAVVLFALNRPIQDGGNREIITQYIQLVGIVVAFYFGSKATSDAYNKPEKAGTAQDDLDIENVTYDPKGEIQIKVSNHKGLEFQLDRVVINDGGSILIDKDVMRFGSEAFKDLIIPLKLNDDEKKKLEEILMKNLGKEYEITIKTKSIGDNSCKRKMEIIGPMAAALTATAKAASDTSAAIAATAKATVDTEAAKAATTKATVDTEAAKAATAKATVDTEAAKAATTKAAADTEAAKTELEKEAAVQATAKAATDTEAAKTATTMAAADTEAAKAATAKAAADTETARAATAKAAADTEAAKAATIKAADEMNTAKAVASRANG